MVVGRREVLLGGVIWPVPSRQAPARAFSRPQRCKLAARKGGARGRRHRPDRSASSRRRRGLQRPARRCFYPRVSTRPASSRLESGTRIEGVPGETILRYRDGGALIALEGVENVRIAGVVRRRREAAQGARIASCSDRDETSRRHELRADRAAWRMASACAKCRAGSRIARSSISAKRDWSVRTQAGSEIALNHVRDCGGNGIVVSRSEHGEDATIVSANRIERIAATSGGSGQSDDGISVVRASAVVIGGNRIADCASSAIRANADRTAG